MRILQTCILVTKSVPHKNGLLWFLTQSRRRRRSKRMACGLSEIPTLFRGEIRSLIRPKSQQRGRCQPRYHRAPSSAEARLRAAELKFPQGRTTVILAGALPWTHGTHGSPSGLGH
jgi:hypothetical protein